LACGTSVVVAPNSAESPKKQAQESFGRMLEQPVNARLDGQRIT
jgi:hypothetical protein